MTRLITLLLIQQIRSALSPGLAIGTNTSGIGPRIGLTLLTVATVLLGCGFRKFELPPDALASPPSRQVVIVQVDGLTTTLLDTYLSQVEESREPSALYYLLHENGPQSNSALITTPGHTILRARHETVAKSILTGLSPNEHGVVSNHGALDNDLADLHSAARALGYRTLDLGMAPGGHASSHGPPPSHGDNEWRQLLRLHAATASLITVRIDDIVDAVERDGVSAAGEALSSVDHYLEEIEPYLIADARIIIVSGFGIHPVLPSQRASRVQDLGDLVVSEEYASGALVLDVSRPLDVMPILAKSMRFDAYLRTETGISMWDRELGRTIRAPSISNRRLSPSDIESAAMVDDIVVVPRGCSLREEEVNDPRACKFMTEHGKEHVRGSLEAGAPDVPTIWHGPEFSRDRGTGGDRHVPLEHIAPTVAELLSISVDMLDTKRESLLSELSPPTSKDHLQACAGIAATRDPKVEQCLRLIGSTGDVTTLSKSWQTFAEGMHDREVIDASDKDALIALSRLPHAPQSARCTSRSGVSIIHTSEADEQVDPLRLASEHQGIHIEECTLELPTWLTEERLLAALLPALAQTLDAGVVALHHEGSSAVGTLLPQLDRWGAPVLVEQGVDDSNLLDTLSLYRDLATGLRLFHEGRFAEASRRLKRSMPNQSHDLWRSLFAWWSAERAESRGRRRLLADHSKRVLRHHEESTADLTPIIAVTKLALAAEEVRTEDRRLEKIELPELDTTHGLDVVRSILYLDYIARHQRLNPTLCRTKKTKSKLEQRVRAIAQSGHPDLALLAASWIPSVAVSLVDDAVVWMDDPRTKWLLPGISQEITFAAYAAAGLEALPAFSSQARLRKLARPYLEAIITPTSEADELDQGDVLFLLLFGDTDRELLDEALDRLLVADPKRGQDRLRLAFWTFFMHGGGYQALLTDPVGTTVRMLRALPILEKSIEPLEGRPLSLYGFQDRIALSTVKLLYAAKSWLLEDDPVSARKFVIVAEEVLPSTDSLLKFHGDKTRFGWWGIYLKLLIQAARGTIEAAMGDTAIAQDYAKLAAGTATTIANHWIYLDAEADPEFSQRVFTLFEGIFQLLVANAADDEDIESFEGLLSRAIDEMESSPTDIQGAPPARLMLFWLQTFYKTALYIAGDDFDVYVPMRRRRKMLKQARTQIRALYREARSDLWIVQYGLRLTDAMIGSARELRTAMRRGDKKSQRRVTESLAIRAFRESLFDDMMRAEKPSARKERLAKDDNFVDVAAEMVVRSSSPNDAFSTTLVNNHKKAVRKFQKVADSLTDEVNRRNKVAVGVAAVMVPMEAKLASSSSYRREIRAALDSRAYAGAIEASRGHPEELFVHSLALPNLYGAKQVEAADSAGQACPMLAWQFDLMGAEGHAEQDDLRGATQAALRHAEGARSSRFGVVDLSLGFWGIRDRNRVNASMSLGLAKSVIRDYDSPSDSGTLRFGVGTIWSKAKKCCPAGSREKMCDCEVKDNSGVQATVNPGESVARTRARADALSMLYALNSGSHKAFDRTFGSMVDAWATQQYRLSSGETREDAVGYAWVSAAAELHGHSAAGDALLWRAREVAKLGDVEGSSVCDDRRPLEASHDPLLTQTWCMCSQMLHPSWLDVWGAWPIVHRHVRERSDMATHDLAPIPRVKTWRLPPVWKSYRSRSSSKRREERVVFEDGRATKNTLFGAPCQTLASYRPGPSTDYERLRIAARKCPSRVLEGRLHLHTALYADDPSVGLDAVIAGLEAFEGATRLQDTPIDFGLTDGEHPYLVLLNRFVELVVDLEDRAARTRSTATLIEQMLPPYALRLRTMALAMELEQRLTLGESPAILLAEFTTARFEGFMLDKAFLDFISQQDIGQEDRRSRALEYLVELNATSRSRRVARPPGRPRALEGHSAR